MLKYLNTESNIVLNGQCSFNKNIQQLWQWGGEFKHNLSITFKNGTRKDFEMYDDRNKLLQDADNYLQEITPN